jgi:amidase
LGAAINGSISHTVEDAAAMLDALQGRPLADGPDALLARHLQDPGPLRIGICTGSPLLEVRRENADAVRGTARALEGLGHTVDETGPLALGTIQDFLPVMQRMVANIPVLRRSALQPISRWMHDQGRRVTRADAGRLFQSFEARVLAWFGSYDLVVLPTIAVRPPTIGQFAGRDPVEAFLEAAQLGVFTAPFNLSGQPACSVPAGLDAEGLPMGVQLVGRVGADLQVLQVARQLETAVPWVHRRASSGGVRPVALTPAS